MFQRLEDVEWLTDNDADKLVITKEALYKIIDALSTFKGIKGFDIDPNELKERLETDKG